MKNLILAGLMASVATVASAEALRVGMSPEPYMPLTSMDASGTWIGLEADLTNRICEMIEGGCDIRQMAWEALIPSLREGKVDFVVGGFSVTEERKAVLNFTTPYQMATHQLIGMKSDAFEAKLVAAENGTGEVLSEEGLDKKAIGAQGASVQAIYTETYLQNVELKTYAAADMVFSDLLAGRIDYAMVGDGFGDDFLTTEAGADYEFKMVLPQNPVLGEGVAYGVAKEQAEALEKLNAALQTLIDNGELAAMLEKWGL